MKQQIEGLPADDPRRIAYNFACWREAMELSHAMLMAGLRNQVGPDGDVQAAYRRWNAERRRRKLAAYDRAAQRYFQRDRRPNPDQGSCDATDRGD